MSSPLFAVQGLRKSFPIKRGLLRRNVGEVCAVDGVDFAIEKGHVVGLVGESGCGKSTTARAAIRLIEPTGGAIHFQGEDLLKMGRAELKAFRRHAQIIFQDPFASLNPRKTIFEVIGEALAFHGLASTVVEQRSQTLAMLERVGLSAAALDRYPHQFSGGQQQRICIARALVLKPKLLICDEVVSALDVSVQAQILNLLSDLREELGLSYLFISHDLSVVRYLCDEVLVMWKGKVVERGSAARLFAHPQHPYTKRLLAAIPDRHPQISKNMLS